MNVITFGTFDLFHVGHLRILERASKYGTLFVGVSSDEMADEKGKPRPVVPYEERAEIVRSIRYVYHVFKEESLDRKRDYINMHGADLLIMGDDWKGRFDDINDTCTVLYLPRTPMISTTALKAEIRAQ